VYDVAYSQGRACDACDVDLKTVTHVVSISKQWRMWCRSQNSDACGVDLKTVTHVVSISKQWWMGCRSQNSDACGVDLKTVMNGVSISKQWRMWCRSQNSDEWGVDLKTVTHVVSISEQWKFTSLSLSTRQGFTHSPSCLNPTIIPCVVLNYFIRLNKVLQGEWLRQSEIKLRRFGDYLSLPVSETSES
jgi:hypothetical protein